MFPRSTTALLFGAAFVLVALPTQAEERHVALARNDQLTQASSPAPLTGPTTRAGLGPAFSNGVPKANPAEPSGFGALMLGAATALVPVGIGATILARAPGFGTKNVGFVVAGAGFVVAPLFAHGIHGEWGRGALFCIPPAAAETGMIAIVSAKPDAVFSGTTLSRTSFVGLFTVNVFTSAIGIVDAALVADRRRGHGLFSQRKLTHFGLTQIAPGAGTSPYGITLTLSL